MDLYKGETEHQRMVKPVCYLFRREHGPNTLHDNPGGETTNPSVMIFPVIYDYQKINFKLMY